MMRVSKTILSSCLTIALLAIPVPAPLQAQTRASGSPLATGDSDFSDMLFNPLKSNKSQAIQPASADALVSPPSTVTGALFDTSVKPFGSQLFSSPSALSRPIGSNQDYIVTTGDQVSIQLWGAQSYSGTQVVDAQGNIFLPEIGPVKIGGRNVAHVNAVVNNAIHQVFTANVTAYVNVASRQPVGVYVTGAVRIPGHFAGDRTASPLYYLSQAGGIDPKSGSYRDIRVMRGGALLAQLDLYQFLLAGSLPTFQFLDNDVIFVGTQGATVIAKGDVQNNYRFEVDMARVTGNDIVTLARPQPSVSHVSVKGLRQNQPYNAYVSLGDFATMPVANGDEVTFVADRVTETIFVNVTGQSAGPSSFTVARGTRLGDVLKLIEIDPQQADPTSIYLRRVSVAERQKRALEMSLNELQRAVLTSTSTSSTESGMRTQEAQLVERFISKARAVQPEGRVVLANIPGRDELRLEADDVIVIPDRSQVVMISGEVRVPQTLMYQPGVNISDYIEQAGGYTNRAEIGDYVIIRRNGAALLGSNLEIWPGDQIMVMPSAGEKGFAMFKDFMEVLYRVAVSTAVVLRVTD